MRDLQDIRELINPEGITDGKIVAAQARFYDYCKMMNPKFYRDDRPYQRDLCETLQAIFEGRLINKDTGEPYKNLMINLPPRHGKSYTLTLFVQWCMGKKNNTRVISVSYNDILAGRFARNVRDGIDADKIDSKVTIFHDVFPTTRVKQGDAAAQLWSLEGQFFNYLATGFGGTITGIGCSMGIIDDPIKNDQEAFNDRVLDEQWSWYTDTFLSRIEEGGMQIIVMTRWSTKDLCGRLLASEDGGDWFVFCRRACLDEGERRMLCPDLLSWKSYMKKRRLTSAEIADANYQQEPVDIKGKLYSEFRTYEQLPRDAAGKLDFGAIISYTDTADTGSDDLCSIVAGIHEGEGYILDVIMTDEPMEKTEPQTAEQLYSYHVETARIESNNGGRGFARNVERLLWELYQTRSVNIEWFHQGANKHARIMTGATFVMQHLLFPSDWAQRWPRYDDTFRHSCSSKFHIDSSPPQLLESIGRIIFCIQVQIPCWVLDGTILSAACKIASSAFSTAMPIPAHWIISMSFILSPIAATFDCGICSSLATCRSAFPFPTLGPVNSRNFPSLRIVVRGEAALARIKAAQAEISSAGPVSTALFQGSGISSRGREGAS